MFWHCGMSASTANFFAGRKVCNSFFLSKTRHMVPTKQTKSRRARWAVTRERAADFACTVSTTMYSVCVRVFACVCNTHLHIHIWTILFLFGFYSTLEGVFTLATRLQRQKEIVIFSRHQQARSVYQLHRHLDGIWHKSSPFTVQGVSIFTKLRFIYEASRHSN